MAMDYQHRGECFRESCAYIGLMQTANPVSAIIMAASAANLICYLSPMEARSPYWSGVAVSSLDVG